jgi:2-dehydro-3-deoxygluconokinase
MDHNHRFDLITLGETMLRLMPPQPLRLGQSQSLALSFGGAESNVAANLARLGRRTSWWSRLPDNPLGHQLISNLRGHGVDTEDVLFCQDERLGIYFIEYGATPRGIKVWYDRANSAASHMQSSQLPDSWLMSADWLHLTGITPALSQSCRELVSYAMRQAQVLGAKVSFDVNYRALLWSPEEAARQLASYCQAANVTFIARRDAQQLFALSGETAAAVAGTLQSQWGDIVIVTDGDLGAAGCDGNKVYTVPALTSELVDRIGAGDAFASGVLDRLLDGAELNEALVFGTGLAALKLSIAGDVAVVTRQEVQHLLDASGPVLRR